MNPTPTPNAHYDAVVVGARVAGAATAMLLARAGLRVLVVDRSRRGSDTLSTHALMRAGVMQLHRWGVLPRLVAAGTPPIRRTTFHYGSEPVQVEIKDRDGVDALYAPRRTVLDVVLADAAVASGAKVLYGGTASEILRTRTERVQGVLVTDAVGRQHRVEADIVIGADGARSTVGRAVDARVICEGRHPGSYVYAYWKGLELDGTHWHYGSHVAAGAIPTNEGLSCVFVGMPPGRIGYETPWRQVEAMLLEAARRTPGLRTSRSPSSSSSRWATSRSPTRSTSTRTGRTGSRTSTPSSIARSSTSSTSTGSRS